MKTVMAGPILGELGWIIFDVMPHVAGFFAQHVDEHKVVVCRPEHQVFFPDALEFVDIPEDLLIKEDIGRGWWTGKPTAPVKRVIAWAHKTVNPDELLFIPYFQVKKAEWGVDPLNRPLVSLPREIEESWNLGEYIVVAARQLKRGPKKNWDPKKWDYLVRSMKDHWMYPIYAIGKEGSSYVPKGTIERFHTMEDSIHLLNNARFCVTSNSGTTHLSTMSGCSTFSWGSSWLKHRVTQATNPMKTEVHFEGVGWNPDPGYIFDKLRLWVHNMELDG